jgi:hypothetical protein
MIWRLSGLRVKGTEAEEKQILRGVYPERSRRAQDDIIDVAMR